MLDSVSVPSDDIDPDFTKFFVVREGDSSKIIGCIGLELFTGTALFRSFAVDPMYQGNQIGQSLINRLLDEAAQASSEAVYVCKAKVPGLFLKIGFIGIDLDDVPNEIRNSTLFKENCPRVAAFMMKRSI
ncbi:MAG: GNAT family N-acetyltransferase [Candidatus Thorarchaeota archaeon]